jgi:hypothetical protein
LFSEQRPKNILTDVGSFLSGFFYGIPLIESYGASQVVEDANLPPQRDFELLKAFWFLVRIASGLHHRLMRFTDRIDVLGQAPAQHFRFLRLYRIAGKAEQDFGYANTSLRTIDGIGLPVQLGSFSLETFETFVVLTPESVGVDRAGAHSDGCHH